MSEIEQQIEEAVGMAHDGKQLQRKQCYFVPEAEYRRLKAQERVAAKTKEQLSNSKREVWIHWITEAATLAIAGVIFVAAAIQGLMEPVFGGIIAAGCALGAVGSFRGWRACRK